MPYTGSESVFDWTIPGTQLTTLAAVLPDKLRLAYHAGNLDEPARERVKTQCKEDLTAIQRKLDDAGMRLAEFLARTRTELIQAIDIRKAQLNRASVFAGSLGVPIRKREDIPVPCKIPIERKVISPTKQRQGTATQQMLAIQEYEQILACIAEMAKVIERNPETFAVMEEPAIRDVFLIPLNAIFEYKGRATGETFNAHGKTDILVRNDQNTNVFVAECKFWDGPESLKSALNQLMNYITWRDTQTALIILVRRKDFTRVLNTIPTTIRECQGFEADKPCALDSTTNFRFSFHHREDAERSFLLTVLAFHVPDASDSHAQP